MVARRTAQRAELLARAGLVALQLAALVWFRGATRGFPLDDAWIHQVVARTFATSGTLGYAPGQHGAGATSYAWAAVLAVNLKWLHVDPVRWSFAVNALLSVLTGQLLYAIVARVRPAGVREVAWRGASLAAAAFACTTGNVLWFACSGMEVNAFVALSLVAIWAATREHGSERARARDALLAGVAAGLLALVRPEGAALGALLLVFARDPTKTGLLRSSRLLLAAPWLVAVAAYVTVNVVATGHVAPPTFAGRRWLWFDASRGLTHLDLVADLGSTWLLRLHHFVLAQSWPVSWVALGLALHGALRLLRLRSRGLRLLFAWGLAHTAFYVLLLPTPGHGGRYQPFVPLLFPACVVIGTALVAWDLTRLLTPATRLDVLVGSVVLWLPGLAGGASVMKGVNHLAVAHIEATELGAGAYVRTLPPSARVASFDIGGIGWAADRPIVDLGGLGDPAVVRQLEEGRIWELLAAHGIAFLVLPGEYAPRVFGEGDFLSRLALRDSPQVTLTPVFRLATAPMSWLPAVGATSNAAAVQTVYAVEYRSDRAQPAHPSSPPPAAALSSQRSALDDPGGLVHHEDRAIAEHTLALLAAWGFAIDLHVSASPRPGATPERSGCEVWLGPWGLSLRGCAAAPDTVAVHDAAFETVLPFLDAGDMGGAARAVLRALARARQRREPAFAPPDLPPTPPPLPGGRVSAASRTVAWGAPLMLAVLVTAWASRFARVWLRRFRRSRARGAARAALAVALLAMAGCTDAAPLPHAAAEGGDEVLEALARGAPLEQRDEAGRTALLVAAQRADVPALEALLARGAAPDAQLSDGTTALHLASRASCVTCLRLLVAKTSLRDAGAGPRRRTALHEAALAGNEAVVRALLAAGLDVNLQDSFGATPLHLVAIARRTPGRELAASLLLAGGADWHITDGRGFTALHAAAAADDATLVHAIVESAGRAGIDDVTARGERALDVAQRYEAQGAYAALLEVGATARTERRPDVIFE